MALAKVDMDAAEFRYTVQGRQWGHVTPGGRIRSLQIKSMYYFKAL